MTVAPTTTRSLPVWNEVSRLVQTIFCQLVIYGMDLDLGVRNRDVGLVEGELDNLGQCEFGSEIASGFRLGTNRQVHTVVG